MSVIAVAAADVRQYAGLSLRDIYVNACQDMSCKINSRFIKSLPTRPSYFDEPTLIDLSTNYVGAKGLQAVLEVVRCCTHLKTLDLRDQQIDNDMCQKIVDVLVLHPTVLELNMSNNAISIVGGQTLVSYVKSNRVIERVLIDDTDIRPFHLHEIGRYTSGNIARKAEMLNLEVSIDKMREKMDSGGGGASGATSTEIAVGRADADGSSGQQLQNSICGGGRGNIDLRALDPIVTRAVLDRSQFSISTILFDEPTIADKLSHTCSKNLSHFQDTQFPPLDTSIDASLGGYQHCVSSWRRLVEEHNPSVFPENDEGIVPPRRVDAAFAWVFQALFRSVSSPAEIRNLIAPNTGINPTGVYSVKFFIDGAWRYVLVDDAMPMNATGMEHAFCRPDDGYFWPCILLKAVAKLHRSYRALDMSVEKHPVERAACPATTMRDFSAGVSANRLLQHKEFVAAEWWQTMMEMDTTGTKMLATSRPDALVLDQNHTFEVMRVVQIDGFRLLQLRSLYAEYRWHGEWCNESPLWEQYPDIATSLGYNYAQNRVDPYHTFWMSYERFLATFKTVHLCRSFGGYCCQTVEGEWGPDTAGGGYFEQNWVFNPRYELKTQVPSVVFINLSVADRRFVNEEGYEYDYDDDDRHGDDDTVGGGGGCAVNKEGKGGGSGGSSSFSSSQVPTSRQLSTTLINNNKSGTGVGTSRAAATAASAVDTIGFHVLRGEHFPLLYDKDKVVARTSYVMTTSVSFDGTLSNGKFWIVPSTYKPGCRSRFLIRCYSTSPFVLTHRSLPSAWRHRDDDVFVESSGEYQNGEDNPQWLISIPNDRHISRGNRTHQHQHQPGGGGGGSGRGSSSSSLVGVGVTNNDGNGSHQESHPRLSHNSTTTTTISASGSSSGDGSGGNPARLLIQARADGFDNQSLALFLCRNAYQPTERMVGPIGDEHVVARSQFVLGDHISLDCVAPNDDGTEHDPGDGFSHFIVVPAVYPEGTACNLRLTFWSSQLNFIVKPLPLWNAKNVEIEWTGSGGFREIDRNPQVELITRIPEQLFVVRLRVYDAFEPSTVFFILDNDTRCGEPITTSLQDTEPRKLVCQSPFMRHSVTVREFFNGPSPPDSYIILPCLQPPGSRARGVITVSSRCPDFTLRVL